MSDTEKEKFRQIGIDLINEYRVRGGFKPIDWLAVMTPEASAFIRSIQLHEKTKKELQGVKQELADFRQEVSEAIRADVDYQIANKAIPQYRANIVRFYIPAVEPDPLVEIFDECFNQDVLEGETWSEAMARKTRAAMDARGLELREKSDG